MCKRNSPDNDEASLGCVRKTSPMKKRNQYGMFKTNFPDKTEGNTGCVRETSQIKTKSAWDV